jgi:hypothetical protein
MLGINFMSAKTNHQLHLNAALELSMAEVQPRASIRIQIRTQRPVELHNQNHDSENKKSEFRSKEKLKPVFQRRVRGSWVHADLATPNSKSTSWTWVLNDMRGYVKQTAMS